MNIIETIKKEIIVSVQAMPKEPLYQENCMLAMMKTCVLGGAKALRVAGVRDVKNAKAAFDIPVIGITKPDVTPTNWRDIVYITPTVKDAASLIAAGADIIAFDGTMRNRPNNNTLEQIIKHIKFSSRLSMADISTFEEGINAINLGADIISTTLSGYTQHSPQNNEGPDFELLEKLTRETKKPVILEGRIWNPEDIKKAFVLGAHSVVIGSAITRPRLITKRFVEAAK